MTTHPTITATPQPETPFAITSLVLGCVGVLMFWLYGIVPILAIIFGGISISKSRKAGVKPSGMATAGLVLGIVELSVVVLFVIAIIAAA